MKTLIIAPLALPSSISLYVSKLVSESAASSDTSLYLQTAKHPSARFITEKYPSLSTMDDLYDTSADFDELNAQISERLVNDTNDTVVFAVMGRGVGQSLFSTLSSRVTSVGAALKVIPSTGYAEAAIAAAGINNAGICVVSANELPETLNPYAPLCVEEIDTKLRASEVKLALTEFYPDEAQALFAYTDINGDYSIRRISLFELDMQCEYFATTSVIINAFKFGELSRYGTEGVVDIMRILRAPGGCPWDREQTHESLKTPLIEEAYEVIDAINNNDIDGMIEELGDLLLQVVFHAQIESERREFDIRDVCTGIVNKLIFRHPHVFANMNGIKTADDVLVEWEVLKKKEKQQKSQSDVINSVPKSFPALTRAWKVQKKAASVGFDWANPTDAMQKIAEESDEVKQAADKHDTNALADELGDLLFSAVNVTRLYKVDPEIALNAATDKFVSRFCEMENLIIADEKCFNDMTLAQMDIYWERAKHIIAEKG